MNRMQVTVFGMLMSRKNLWMHYSPNITNRINGLTALFFAVLVLVMLYRCLKLCLEEPIYPVPIFREVTFPA